MADFTAALRQRSSRTRSIIHAASARSVNLALLLWALSRHAVTQQLAMF
jgi:hypothetical protein